MPNLFADVRGRDARIKHEPKRDASLQAYFHGQGNVNLKVMEGPFLFSGGTVAAKKGVRYFIHSAFITGVNTAAGTGTVARWLGTLNGASQYFCTILSESGVQRTVTQNQVINVLLDENTAITVNQAGVWTALNMGISYAEVPTEHA